MLYVHKSYIPRRSSLARLRRALQLAIELEHATIPIYLYALYSLKPDRNAKIASLIESVVKDEMLHMMLACNLLNAVGGQPQLDAPGFIVRYPGPVPGSVAGRLRLRLEPFSKSVVRRVFMRIESPDQPLFLGGGPYVIPPNHRTIGDLYRAIEEQLQRIAESGQPLFIGDARRQVTHPYMPELIAIHNLATARHAIETIIEQGEGAPTTPMTDDGKYAHFYRFAEIYRGREIEINRDADRSAPPAQRYRYSGDSIPFDSKGVWRVPLSPRARHHAPGTKARRAADTFNYTYTAMLRTLHAVVNDQPQRLQGAIGQMFSLRQQAMDMASGKSTGRKPVGASFEYQPLNPA